MKRTLILVRHAKSSWDDAGRPDRERPLAERGRRDAPLMGKRLAAQQFKPDLILSSPALRALTTAEMIARELGYKSKDIVVDERLYATSPETLLAVIGEVSDQHKCVLVCGHNPEFSELASRFASDITLLPTCAVAEFAFDAKSWAKIGATRPASVTVDYPKKG